jgi:hypothetical protein
MGTAFPERTGEAGTLTITAWGGSGSSRQVTPDSAPRLPATSRGRTTYRAVPARAVAPPSPVAPDRVMLAAPGPEPSPGSSTVATIAGGVRSHAPGSNDG